jgi:aspartyl/asparaginyl beta-hydroxylase (cupin superfamily)
VGLQPCHLIVGGEPIVWREGHGVLFDDFFLHEAHNPTSRPRVVLFLDVLRSGTSRVPLVELVNALVIRVLGKSKTIRDLMER